MSNVTPIAPENGLDVRPIAGHIGAELVGLDLKRPLDAAQISAIRAALLQYKALVVRGQHIDHADQIRFTRYFGEVTPSHPYDDEASSDHPEILVVDNQRFDRRNGKKFNRWESRNHWHSDITAAVNPPAVTFLRAGQVPEQGGDTAFTNLARAYENLPEVLKPFVESLRAEHRFGGRRPYWADRDDNYLVKNRSKQPFISEHPVVRVHPETGEKLLFVNPGFTSHIVGLSPSQSDRILELLFDAVTDFAHTVRVRWEPGTLVFWDNRSTAHLAPTDIDSSEVHRVLYRTTIVGDVPVGVDGRPSIAIEGAPFIAQAAE